MKKYRILLPICLSLFITFIAFLPSLKNGFTNWDDCLYVTENKDISVLSPENITKFFTSSYVAVYLPVTMLSYSLDYYFFKLDPFGYHTTNLIYHLLNCLLLFWLIFILSDKIYTSFLAALFFAVHPLHVESVAWIAERKDVLSTFFFLASLICYLYYRKNESIKYYFLSLFIFILSLLAKPMAVTMPFVLLLFDYFFRRKFSRPVFLEKIPFLIISVSFGIIALFTQITAIRHVSYTFLDNAFIASYGLLFYMYKMLLPLNLSCLYPYPAKINNLLPLPFLLSPLILLLLVLLIFISLRKTRKVLFGFSFFLFTILPVIKLVPLGNAITADRYSYIPSIGIFYLLGEGFSWLYTKKLKYLKTARIFLVVILIVITGSLSFLTWHRCQVWMDGVTLWTDFLNKYPDNIVGYINRGNYYNNTGQYDSAIADYIKALSIQPAHAGLYNDRGNAYDGKGEYDKAMADYNRALSINPSYAEAYYNRGILYDKKGESDKAISDFTRAIMINPNYVEAYINRGIDYEKKGEFDRTIYDYNRVLAIAPNASTMYFNRGITYYEKGEYDKSILDFTQAIAINPDYKEAYYNRALTYFVRKEYDKAWEDVEKLKKSGFQINAQFLEDLRKSSGREE